MIFYNSLCVYNLILKKYMKISKYFEPLVAGTAASIIIGILSFLSFETSTGFWLMFSFAQQLL